MNRPTARRTQRAQRGRAGLLLALAAALLALPQALAAQSFDVSGYALGVGTWAGESPLGPSGATLLARARVMPVASVGAFTLDVAYEHVLTRTPSGGGLSITNPGGEAAGSTDWLFGPWTVRSTSRTLWRGRFDRLSLGFEAGPVSVTAGRQAISWGTTLFLTPADPFTPFDPSDPFREYRGGVDAVRLQAFPGPFTELEAVVRGASTPEGDRVTALARAQTSRGGWAFGAWGGLVHEEPAGALFVTGAAGSTALRAEGSVREGDGDGVRLRLALGADRYFTVEGKDLAVLAELLYDGLGAASTSDLLEVASSKWFLRGEMQTLGRWTGAAQASYQIHPLVSVDALVLANLRDGSALLAPGLSWSASGTASVRVGLFAGAGPGDLDPATGFRSEYGAVPVLGYGSISWFF